jgi:hypothetical protein
MTLDHHQLDKATIRVARIWQFDDKGRCAWWPPLAAKQLSDLRHAAVSTWLKAEVELDARRSLGGHSVAALLTVYAKLVDRGEQAALSKIDDALGGAA